MKNRTTAIIAILCLVFAGVYVFYRSGSDQQQKSERNANKKKSSSSDEKQSQVTQNDKQNKDKKEGLLGKAQIPFEQYKQIYEREHPIELADFDQEDTCKNGRGDNFGYAYIDFLFLKKTGNNSYAPHKVFKLYLGKSNDSPYMGAGLGTGEDPSARVRLPVIKDCKSDTYRLKPGRKYRFVRFQIDDRYPGVKYTFEVPEEEELDFVSADSQSKPKPYPYPVFVEDIRATIPGDPPMEETTWTIRNAISTNRDLNKKFVNQETKLGYMSDIFLVYKKDGRELIYQRQEITNDGVYKFSKKYRKGDEISGGNLKIYGGIKWIKGLPSKIKSISQVRGSQLLFYKTNVDQQDIDVSQNATYRYNPKKTVKKEISIDEAIEEKNIDMSKGDAEDAELYTELGNNGEKIKVLSTEVYKKEGTYHTIIEAEPGSYIFLLGRQLLDKNFTWPPKD